MDFWRHIDIAVGEPMVLGAELLADQRATRSYLMRVCLETRKYLGLEPFLLGKRGREPDGAGDGQAEAEPPEGN